MQVGTGRSILNGIAIGKLKIYKKKDTVISTAQVADTAAEEARFEEARAKAIDQQTALYEKALAEAGEDIAEVFNIHAMMLDDDDFVDAIKEIINGQHMCAEYAVKKAGDNQAAVFAAMDDPYLQARSADVIDIAQAMLDILQGVDNATLQGTEPSILVAEDLAPSETVRMDKSLLLGFITREGSSNSHTAILARSINIPALIQCKELQEDWDGKMAVVDGYNACVYVDPTPDLLESLKKRQQEDQKKLALLAELKGKPNTTLDGKTVQVFANIGGMSDVGAVQQNDAGGVGLFRTEFVYLNCTDYPTEEYQFEAYKQVLESLAPKKVVVRTCDIGADKTVDYMKLDHEDNPALGYRAIRICLTRKDFFKTQLRALLQELKGKPNTTLDGKTINVFANIGGMGDVGAVQQNDAGGVGLFRTEFVYLNCKDFPTEDYQFEAYKQVVESLAPRKVVVRTCDIGADKTVDYMKLDHEDNPALGYRAIRICLTRRLQDPAARSAACFCLRQHEHHVPHDHQPAGAAGRQGCSGRVPRRADR